MKNIIGFYQINKLRRSKTFESHFFDIEILLVAPDHWNDADKAEADRVLRYLQSQNGKVTCCMAGSSVADDEGDIADVQKYLHGVVRLVYYDSDENTGEAKYPWYIWEGGLQGSYTQL